MSEEQRKPTHAQDDQANLNTNRYEDDYESEGLRPHLTLGQRVPVS
jgi:hypothetical protein